MEKVPLKKTCSKRLLFQRGKSKKLQQSNQGSAVDNFGKREEFALYQVATYKVTWRDPSVGGKQKVREGFSSTSWTEIECRPPFLLGGR